MTHCSDPHHHVGDSEAFVLAVEAACKAKGLKLTPPRRWVLQHIAQSEKPLKAYDLLEQLRLEHASAAPPTVYRSLEFLIEHGFVHRLESVNAYIACHHPGGEAHATPFLICDQCKSVQEMEQPLWVRQLQTDAATAGFQVREQVLELHGLCAACRNVQ